MSVPGYILALKNRNRRKIDQEENLNQNADRDYYDQQRKIPNHSYNNNNISQMPQKKFNIKNNTSNSNDQRIEKNENQEADFDYNQKQQQDESLLQNDHVRYSSHESRISIPAEEFTEDEIPIQRHTTNISDFDEANESHHNNIDNSRELLEKIRMLELENKNLKMKQESEDSTESLKFAIQQQKNINAQLQIQYDKAQARIAELERIISQKENAIQTMTMEFQNVSATLKDHMDVMSAQSAQLEQANNQIVSLKIEIDRLKRNQNGAYSNKPGSYGDNDTQSTMRQNFDFNQNSLNDTNRYIDTNFNQNSMPQVPNQRFDQNPQLWPDQNLPQRYDQNPQQRYDLAPQPRYDSTNHPAMKDNLKFGDNQFQPAYNNDEQLVQSMSDKELRDKYDELTKVKADIEWKLNRAPPKAANMSHVRAEREKMEAEADELHKKTSRLKLEMKRRHIF